jgi:hypothetical protein
LQTEGVKGKDFKDMRNGVKAHAHGEFASQYESAPGSAMFQDLVSPDHTCRV